MLKLALIVPVGLVIGGGVLLLTGVAAGDLWTVIGIAAALAAGAVIGRWAYPGKWWVAVLGGVACLLFAWIGLILMFALLWSGGSSEPSVLGPA
jgi:hypothetical protein